MMRFIEILYADPLLKFLADTTMKSFVIFVVAGLFVCYFRQKSAAVRGFVWGMAILGCFIVPMFSLTLPKWKVNVLPEMSIQSETYRLTDNTPSSTLPVSIAPSQPSSETVGPTRGAPTPSQSNPVPTRNGILTTMRWTDWMAVVWGGVGLFLLIRLIVGIGAISHLSARSRSFSRATEQLRPKWNRQANVRLSNRITVPMVWGFLRPVILLPVDANHWQTERLRAVLLHELAHIRRWDWTMQMIAQIACAVYWFNPLVWFVAHRMRIETEQACDDDVLNAGYRSTDYAQHLLDITRNMKIAKATSRAAVTIARSSKIEGRLQTILAENLNRHPMPKSAIGIGLFVLLCFAVPMGAMRLAQAVSTKEIFASQPTPSESRSDESANVEQTDRNVETCKQQLLAIGKAIQAYQKEHGDFPEWLSELHPKYLPDENILLCPADEYGGKTYFLINKDPKMSMSYDYQFHPQYRAEKTEERLMYGDVLPLVRCRHHKNQVFECLNLSFAFKVFWSSGVYTPDQLYETVEEAIEALEKGLQRQAGNEQFFHVYRTLAHLYIEVGREEDAEHVISRFKSVIKPDDLRAHFILRRMLETANQHEEVLKVFENLEKRYPENHRVLEELTRIHEVLGNSDLAAKYQKKADPMSELVGKVVPDFSATDFDGKPISLQQYRGKVVLLDFWAVWCGPCLTEMPNVKRVYNSYKDQGFDIIGVSLDTDEIRLRNYLKKNNIPWRQIFSGQKWRSPLARQYHIRSIPAPWLIAKDGTLISRNARGMRLEQLVVAALEDKTENK